MGFFGEDVIIMAKTDNEKHVFGYLCRLQPDGKIRRVQVNSGDGRMFDLKLSKGQIPDASVTHSGRRYAMVNGAQR